MARTKALGRSGPPPTPERAGKDEASRPTDVPLYRQVLEALRADIGSGAFPVGGLLPTEGELCGRFGVSRHTIREAVRRLRDEGLVASRQGSGTKVLKAGTSELFVHEVSSINDLISYAEELRYAIDASGMVVADEALAVRLGCPAGERWLRVEGYRYPQGQTGPIAWAEAFIHADFAGVALYLGRRPGPIHRWVESLYGEPVEKVEQVLSARPAPPEIAAALGAEPGASLFEVRRSYIMASGKVALVAFTLYRPDRFRQTMTLRRVRA